MINMTRQFRRPGCGLLFLLGSISFLLAAQAGAATNNPSRHRRGFLYQHDDLPDVPWSIHYIKVDLGNPDLALHTTLANGTIFGMSTLTDQINALPPGLGEPIAAVNGDFYKDERKYQGDPKGLQIMQGELVSAPCDWTCFWMDPAGVPHMTNVLSLFRVTWPNGQTMPILLNEERTNSGAVLYTPILGPSTRTAGGREIVLERDGSNPWLPLRIGENYTARVREVRNEGDTPLGKDFMVLSLSAPLLDQAPALKPGSIVKISTATAPDLKGTETALGGGPALVRGGKSLHVNGSSPRQPRTAIGWNKTNFFMVVVDGRQRDLSVGMTYSELADYMAKIGCEEALNLDGGGSATFWILKNVANNPSEGHERPNANCLVLVRKKKAPPSANP